VNKSYRPLAPDRLWVAAAPASRGLRRLEIATAEWVYGFNHRRPFQYCDDLTPVHAKLAHYAHNQGPGERRILT
jgi:hypothetical protein